MVMERLGHIEMQWSARRRRHPLQADSMALMRIGLLQAALRRRLLDERAPVVLNRRDPLGTGRDFTLLDSLAEQLWKASDS